MSYLSHLNHQLLAEFEHFLIKVSERTEWAYGLRPDYDDGGVVALGRDVEYFSFLIAADDRMRYIMENIVTLPDSEVSPKNKIGNTIISHFYGGRGIHTLLTGEVDPKKAHVDFERIATGDAGYVDELKRNTAWYHSLKHKFYGTTELHTSIQTAARNFCRAKYADPDRKASLTDVVEWIASWTTDGSMDYILNDVKSLRGMYDFLRTKPGIGEYYGYHCATSNSVNPALPFDHDELFCAPGPGARETITNLFPSLNVGKSKLPYEALIVWLREEQNNLIDMTKVNVHPFFHNFTGSDGKLVFKDCQDNIKTYNMEVACCQFSVYQRLKAQPHLAERRQVARASQLLPVGVMPPDATLRPVKNSGAASKTDTAPTNLSKLMEF